MTPSATKQLVANRLPAKFGVPVPPCSAAIMPDLERGVGARAEYTLPGAHYIATYLHTEPLGASPYSGCCPHPRHIIDPDKKPRLEPKR